MPRCQIEYYEIIDDHDCIGYLCIILKKKFLFSFLGSPLPGTAMYMGPLIDRFADQAELMRLLMSRCRKEFNTHVDLINNWLNPDIMQTAGFQVESGFTQI